MRYMIDTRTISKERPSPEQIALNEWKIREMKLMGFVVPYDSSGGGYEKYKINPIQVRR